MKLPDKEPTYATDSRTGVEGLPKSIGLQTQDARHVATSFGVYPPGFQSCSGLIFTCSPLIPSF